MPTGTVKWFDVTKGYGSVSQDNGQEFFVHQSRISGTGFRYLLPDEPVEFDVEFDEQRKRYNAVNVRPPEGRQRGVVSSFDHAKGWGRIRPEAGGPDIFFHFTGILKQGKNTKATAEEGERVQFDVDLRPDGSPHAVKVKREDSRLPLFRFADMGPDEKWLSELAKKAEPEKWQHSANPSKHSEYPILKSYVTYTFARLEHEDLSEPGRKIAMGRDGSKALACFNTGLVTANQQPIYALFENKRAESDGRKWKLVGFPGESDHTIMGKFQHFPDLAYFFDDPSVLLYDRRASLQIDIDHVLDDNIWRFPPALRNNKHLAGQLLRSAQAQTEQRVYRNYKTAVPQFHRGQVQLLLPLCLMEPNKPDLALVVSRKDFATGTLSADAGGRHAAAEEVGTSDIASLFYHGDTILPLDMAYSNARLLCRPDSDWLKP